MMPDPLLTALHKERFSSTWWVTTKPEVDSTFMQGVRRRALAEALEDTDDSFNPLKERAS